MSNDIQEEFFRKARAAEQSHEPQSPWKAMLVGGIVALIALGVAGYLSLRGKASVAVAEHSPPKVPLVQPETPPILPPKEDAERLNVGIEQLKAKRYFIAAETFKEIIKKGGASSVEAREQYALMGRQFEANYGDDLDGLLKNYKRRFYVQGDVRDICKYIKKVHRSDTKVEFEYPEIHRGEFESLEEYNKKKQAAENLWKQLEEQTFVDPMKFDDYQFKYDPDNLWFSFQARLELVKSDFKYSRDGMVGTGTTHPLYASLLHRQNFPMPLETAKRTKEKAKEMIVAYRVYAIENDEDITIKLTHLFLLDEDDVILAHWKCQ